MRGSEGRAVGRRVAVALCGMVVVTALAGCEGRTILEGEPIEVPPGGGPGAPGGPALGETIQRTWGGSIGDLVVDPERGLLYASIIDRNEIEVLDWAAGTRVASIPVGSQPSGIALDVTGDTLIVANSGGTSLSFVDLVERLEHSRMETHNAVLFTIEEDVGDDEVTDSTVIETITFWEDVGDRPHRVAQDRDGVIFYSTVGGGPIRMVETYPEYATRESNMMLWSDVLARSEGSWAVTYVDSMVIEPESIYMGGTTLVIYDHVAGQPDQLISASGTTEDIGTILDELRAQGSDVFYQQGVAWEADYWNVGAETHFAPSADGSTIAIGDADRVWTWQANGPHPGYADRIISSYFSIGDLTSNGLSGLSGLAADETGSQFAARGGGSVLYFNDVLRLHGSHTMSALEGAGGLVRHPTEPWAFAATGSRSILVLETTGHYRVLAELPLAESLVGPLRLSLPRDDDAAELLLRLHGVTADGDVVTIPVGTESF